MKESGSESSRDVQALAEITALWRQLRALRAKPENERSHLLTQLGVSADAQRHLTDLLNRLGEINILEPGTVSDGFCPLGWQPGVLAPAFYGFSDFGAADGLPTRVRVFYPSAEGSPLDAPIIHRCGRFPLVAFLHGQCSEPDHFLKWDLVPAELARSGYVVAVPQLASIPPFGGSANPDVARVNQVVNWMRTSWAHAALLMPRPMTAIVGHSWGALLAAVVAAELAPQGAVSAYASLSGGWLEWPSSPPRPLASLNMATMFMWGTGSSDLYANLAGGGSAIWNEPPGAAHKVVFRDGEHWDYFRDGSTTCGLFRGPCGLMRNLAADFLAMFLSHYMPPEWWLTASATIPHSLVPPPFPLTPRQEFFAGSHLEGLKGIGTSPTCSVTHTWRLPPYGGGSITLGGA